MLQAQSRPTEKIQGAPQFVAFSLIPGKKWVILFLVFPPGPSVSGSSLTDTKAKHPGMEGWLAGFRRAGKIQLQGCMHLSRTHPRGASETVVPREKLRGAQKLERRSLART